MAATFTRREALLGLSAASLAPAWAGDALRKGAIPHALRSGFNLPDQVPLRADQLPDASTLKTLRQMGLTHIRLPVVTEYLLPSFSGPATISSAMDDLSRALEMLLSMDYSVSVDMHPDSDFQNLYRRDAKAAHGALLANWPVLARHLSRWPDDRIWVELLNEPPTTDDDWRPFSEKLANVVRSQLPKNGIIVGPAPYQRHENLASWIPFADRNIVYAFHYYDPMAFTHQNAVWDKGSAWARMSDIPFPTEAGDATLLRLATEAGRRGDQEVERILKETAAVAWTAASIEAQLAGLAAWSETHGAPVIVNEFGVLRWKAKRADRRAWIAAVRAAAERHGFGWAHWDYSTSFGLLNDDRTIDRGVVQALLGG
ncbi:glycoside hydrolase family 5 protein [Methylocystis parvus]|uniref:Glycoside hydrolase family 5 protein n=1 Tax=Methylocystis parvus TaxID=134 RepID=A0A6B8M545_9HYPH|nr:cellulase family glycosylhydrolase [Methylocystis parvus]QGM99094.1 glycoside hydrolase family 5 protein [Methylocystis parvus]WBK00537.1 glycoside hydrolase family 5 protein [Methylocystis parvus OBBP]